MDDHGIDAAGWYNATTLHERLAARRSSPAAVTAEFDRELAARELQYWKSQEPFDRDSYFAERLALDAIGEEELLALLGEPVAAVRARFTQQPSWLREVAEAFRQPSAS